MTSYSRNPKSGLKLLGRRSALAVAIAMASAGVAQAQEGNAAASAVEEVIVTGFRASLERALDVKRNNVGAVDAIMADDIADFPDQNLAESLQRIPGIAITRDSGEGRAITVRGLSGEFTRIRINGMEAIAATGGEGGPNRGRGFDFNVFASELFSSIVVRKTATADVDEGSLGAVVDLNTGQPFNYEEGVTFVTSGELQYNGLTEESGPRVSGLFAYHDPNGIWGVSLSAAYSDTTAKELGHNTVRWQQAPFASVEGVDCLDAEGDLIAGAGNCAEVANAFHPRIPRYGVIEVDRKRLGLTGGLQFRPSDKTTIGLDVLYSEYDAARGEKWLEVLMRGNEEGMDVTDYTYDPETNNLTTMTVDNAWLRSENFEKAWTTTFHQVGLRIDHEFSDELSGNLLVGTSQSKLDFPHEITFMYDDRAYDNYHYDYTDDENPILAFNGRDVADPTIYQMSEVRDRPSLTKHGFDNLAADVEWFMNESFSLQAGVNYKKFTFDATGFERDQGVCAAGLYDCDLDNDGEQDPGVYGIPATDALSDIYTFEGDVAAGSTSRWAIPNLGAWSDAIGLSDLPLVLDKGDTSVIEEQTSAVFVQLNGDIELGGMDFMFDVGGRYARTDQKSSGYVGDFWRTIDRDPYSDFLPSLNTALYLTPDLVWRFSAAKVMTRPGLGSLSPGGSVDDFNYEVSYQNPYLDPTRANSFDTSLEWYFSDESLLSLALFHKDIESRPINTLTTGTYASTGLPLSLLNPTSPAGQDPEGETWEISSLGNGPGAKIKGAELAIQTPLSIFGGEGTILDNFGVIANYTYVDSDVTYTFGDRDGDGEDDRIQERLEGLSNNSYNATLYYEDNKFDARISAAYRDDYHTGKSGNNNRFEGYAATLNVDFTAGYTISDQWSVSLEALNLTDNYQDRWVDMETDRRYEYDHTGRVFKVGVKYQL